MSVAGVGDIGNVGCWEEGWTGVCVSMWLTSIKIKTIKSWQWLRSWPVFKYFIVAKRQKILASRTGLWNKRERSSVAKKYEWLQNKRVIHSSSLSSALVFQCHCLKISIIPHINITWFSFSPFHLPLKSPTRSLLELCANASLLHLLTDVQKCQEIQKAASEYISVFSVGSFHTSLHFVPIWVILQKGKGKYKQLLIDLFLFNIFPYKELFVSIIEGIIFHTTEIF